MPDFKLISADSHVNEPPAAWERVQEEYGERAPRVAKDPPGVPKGIWLLIDGLPPVGLSHYSKGLVVSKNKGISEVEQEKHFETIRFNESFRYEDYPGGWEPSARLKDQDLDGVEAEVLFSSAARQLYSITDEPYQRAIFHSYNDWLHEFCAVNPRRLIGLALIPILNMEHTVADIFHYAKLGFRGVQLPTRIKDSGYYEPVYEPMWGALEETGMVINVHTSATQGVARKHYEGPREADPRTQSLGLATKQAPAQQFLGNLILSGVFDRHPKLKIVCAEFDVGWVANLVQQVDYWFGRASTYDAEKNINKLPPSEYFKRNAFFTYQDDRAGVLTTSVYGADNFLWASDYPHGVTTWPNSKETVDRNCAGIDPVVKKKLNRENVVKLYQLADGLNG
ncbi:MAG TPA: amidohydrolase family protein [Terriglobales bacterium]|jgi:predicted TIM-barrel fold metal-dependent hydrolase|nr:amidohydrolase family protein [Terriglobales bacterium]